MRSFKILFYLILPGLILLVSNSVQACTLWGATGQATKDSITIIAKNRDWTPDEEQWLGKFPAVEGKLGFVGICTGTEDKPEIKAGINEKGLVVITASASCIPRAIRTKDKTKKILTTRLLTKYGSVTEILNSTVIFQGTYPVFYMVADQTQIAYIEVGLDGQYAIRSTTDGVLSHTNHYLEKSLMVSNLKIGKSSRIRLQRIRKLLASQSSGFTMDDFKRISNDKADGPDCSIFRMGSTTGSERTVASWIVALPVNGPASLYIKLWNPGQDVKEFQLTLGKNFWQGEKIE